MRRNDMEWNGVMQPTCACSTIVDVDVVVIDGSEQAWKEKMKMQ